MSVATIGLDLAKSVFQVHGVDAGGHAVPRRRIRRQGLVAFFEELPPCLVGMEACPGAHHRAHITGHANRSSRAMTSGRSRRNM